MKPTNPTSPTKAGSVGRGRQFGADLHRLYLAGKVHLPAFAITYSDSTVKLSQAGTSLQSAATAIPDLVALSRLEQLRKELQNAMRTTAISVYDGGAAVAKIAEDYSRTDLEARSAFERLNNVNRTEIDQAPAPGSWHVPPAAE
jgi:hypothetical protein